MSTTEPPPEQRRPLRAFRSRRLRSISRIADVYHEDRELDADADGVLWTKLMLAEAGFHPGPVKDANVTDVFKSALHEFQRSVPKAGGSKGHYERMTVEDDDAEAKKALDKLDESRKRTWFGKPAEPGANIDLDWRPGNWKKGEVNKGDFLARLRDPTKRMIVWIDDRNWYTDGSYWLDGYYNGTPLVPPDVLKEIHDAPEDLGGGTTDGRGAFEDRDARVDKDARDIARPWIPLQVDFRLLGKGQGLDSKVDAHEGEIAEKVRAAIGPLRVDWTFDEIEKTAKVTDVKEDGNAVGGPLPELDHESNVLLSTFYHPDVTDVRLRARPEGSRTRMALRWVLDKLKTEHDRKDVKRKSAYYNAPVDHGGIRPANAAEYFKAALGHGGESLAPWTAKPDDARQSICTAVHDRVGQEEAQTFDKRIGRAGIFSSSVAHRRRRLPGPGAGPFRRQRAVRVSERRRAPRALCAVATGADGSIPHVAKDDSERLRAVGALGRLGHPRSVGLSPRARYRAEQMARALHRLPRLDGERAGCLRHRAQVYADKPVPQRGRLLRRREGGARHQEHGPARDNDDAVRRLLVAVVRPCALR